MPGSFDVLESPDGTDTPVRRALPFSLIVVLFIVAAGIAVLNSPYFRVSGVLVSGSSYMSHQEVLLIADVPRDRNVFYIPIHAIEKRLLAAPRIAKAKVTRLLPNTIQITIQERATAAYLPYAGYFIELDDDGHAIGVSEAVTDPDIPVIVGVRPTYVAVGEPVRPDGPVRAGAHVGAALVRAGISNLSEVDVSSADDVTLRTSDGIKVFIGKPDDVESKAALLDSLLSSVREQGTHAKYIDIRVEARPVIGTSK